MKTPPTQPAAHTSGPWLSNGSTIYHQFSPGGHKTTIADISGEPCIEQRRGNAELIASAPTLAAENAKLREALKNFLSLDKQDPNEYCERLRERFIRECPEYVGYLKQAKAALSPQ